MKTFTLLPFLLPALLAAQRAPDFAVPLHFEDARGNRDSIVIGYDANTPPNVYDPELGEGPVIPFDTPYDSIFEVRTYTSGGAQTKVNILSAPECGRYADRLGNYIHIDVKILYSPLTVRWDRGAFEDFCRRRSFIQPHLLGPLQGDYSDITYFQQTDSVVFSDADMLWFSDSTIREMHIQFITGVSSAEDAQAPGARVRVFPNPAVDEVRIETDGWRPHRLHLHTLDGRRLETRAVGAPGEPLTVSLGRYPPGAYLLRLVDTDGRQVTRRVVKRE